MKLEDVLVRKQGNPVTVSADTSAGVAIQRMYEAAVGSVLVTSAEGKLVGIFTERDVFHLCADGEGANLNTLTMSDCMTNEVIVAKPSDSVDDVLGLMTAHRFRRMPVVVDDVIVGIVSIGDLVKAKLEETVDEAQALRQYIAS